MSLAEFFTVFQYLIMGSAFVALLLIFLYAYYGKEEEQTNQ